MNISAHHLEPVSNFIAKSSSCGPVLCVEVAPGGGGTMNLFFHSEKEINNFLELIFKGKELLQEATKEYKRGAE